MLKSVEDVVRALGGTNSLAKTLGLRPQAVSEWKRRGSIPAEYFFLLSPRVLGRVDPRVFGFKTDERA